MPCCSSMSKTSFNLEAINRTPVPQGYAGYRVDRYLAGRFTYMSRSRWQEEIRKGNVLYNGIALTNFHKKVRGGDEIEYLSRSVEEPRVNRDYSILYEDDHLFVVNKPPDLPVHPAGIYFRNTLLMIMQEAYGILLHPAHRLDRETSGAVIMAKRSDAASFIQSNFHLVKKSYLAIVHGRMDQDEFKVTVPIGRDHNSKVRKKRSAYPGAEEHAETLFRKVSVHHGHTLVEARPVTGRQHQIRVHLSYSGYPILGDKLYGLDENFFLEFVDKGNDPELLTRIGFPRCALHSRSVEFFHPGLGRGMKVEAPLYPDMEEFLRGSGPTD